MTRETFEVHLDDLDREIMAAELQRRRRSALFWAGLVLFNLVVSVFGWSGSPVGSMALGVIASLFIVSVARPWAWVAFVLACWPKGESCHLTVEMSDG